MKVTFLGTGTSQGVPVIACECNVCKSKDPNDKRLRSSVMISEGEFNIVIDTGPDFRQQMLREEVQSLEAIVYTHEHKDHIAGMDDVRAFNFKSGKDMHLYGSTNVEIALKREFFYAFEAAKYPGVPEVNFHRIKEAFDIGPFHIIPIHVLHYKLPVMGFRVGDFTYITDANFIPEKEKEKIKGSKVLVLNALRKQKHLSHFNLEEAVELVNELGPEQAYFTHISHLLGSHGEIEKELPEGINLGFDGLTFDL